MGVGSQVLYAVNAGSNSISAFNLQRRKPWVYQVIDSGGVLPISLTARSDALYVLNNGAAAQSIDQITGFQIAPFTGWLSLLPNSTQGLSAGSVGPAQVGFDPAGKLLVVTEKTTNNIDVFQVDRFGFAGGINVQPSSGMEPFGFAFNKKGFLFVTEAFGGAPAASDVSSYQIDASAGNIHVITPSMPTLQTAACWMAVTRNGRYAYSSNTGSGTVTGFRIDEGGNLTRLNANGVSGVTGGAAIDSGIVGDKFLYVLSHGQNDSSVTGFEIEEDGSLELIGSVGGLPVSSVGLAAQ